MGKVSDLIYDELIGRGKGIRTAKEWRRWMVRFERCCGEKERYERGDVISYLKWMREQGFSQNSINTMLCPVKVLASIQGWTFPKLSMQRVRVSEVNRPVFSYDEVCDMIRKGKEVLRGRELAYLAISTVYGLRREELAKLPDKIGDRLRVETVRGGVVTEHLIADEIKDYLLEYKPTDVTYMSEIFNNMMRKMGVEVNGKRFGWHSIRRALATQLLSADASFLNITRFMRWSEGTLKAEFGMLTIYVKKDQELVDRAIFKIHPFLHVWAEKG